MSERSRGRGAGPADAAAPSATLSDAPLYERALAAAQQSILEWRPGADRVTVGPAFWAQIGRPEFGPSLPLADFLGLVAADDRVDLGEMLRGCAAYEGDSAADVSTSVRIVTPQSDVREFTVALSRPGVRTASDRIVVGIVSDATEARRLRRDLVEARNLAEGANRAKSEFIATISHEIRTPVNGILGMTGLLLDTKLGDEQRDFARTVQESGQALLDIVTDILDFAKVESGKLELEQIAFELPEVVASAVRMTEARAGAKGLDLLWQPDAKLPREVQGDPGRLRQVLLNLISNAIKFTDKGRVVVRGRVLQRKNRVARLRFEIEDTGIGIGESALPKLFQKFSQVDSSIARRYGGTGLGLAVCKSLVDLMAGDIGVESTVGQGSTFWFEIALPEGGAKLARPQPTGAPRAGVPVLVVDDNQVNSRLLVALLTRMGHSSDVVDTGWKAVEAARQGSYGLVMMDVQLPGLDGYEAAAAIRALPGKRGEVPIVAVTADATEGDRERYRHSAINDFVLKPIDTNELTNVVKRWAGTWVGRGAPRADAPSAPADEIIDRAVLSALAARIGIQKTGELVDLYMTDLKERTERMRVALEARDMNALHREAHDLKGTSGSLGLTRLFALGEDIQGATQDGNEKLAFATAAAVGPAAELTIAALADADPRKPPS